MGFELISSSHPVARKQHMCCWCGQHIKVGERYYRYKGVCDGDFQNSAMHTECEAAMGRYFSDPYNRYEYLFPEDTARGLTPSEAEDVRFQAMEAG